MDALKLAQAYAKKLEATTLPDRHRAYQLMLWNARYARGKENLLATDCSGLLSWPLICLGYRVRLTADGFYHNIYIFDASRLEYERDRILAAFYLKNGKARHTAPILGRGVILDAWDPQHMVELKDIVTTSAWYLRQGYDVKIRGLSWDEVYKHSGGQASEAEIDEFIRELYGRHDQ